MRCSIVRIPARKGVIYYSGSLLEERSYARLLEALFREAGVTRPVRLRMAGGGDPWNIEARFAPLGNRKLLYVVNYNPAPARLGLDAVPDRVSHLLDLRDGNEIRGAEITVPAHQTDAVTLINGERSAIRVKKTRNGAGCAMSEGVIQRGVGCFICGGNVIEIEDDPERRCLHAVGRKKIIPAARARQAQGMALALL